MSTKQIKAFYKRLATDEAFQAKLKRARTQEKRCSIWQKAGYYFTQEELEDYTIQWLESSLAEDDLIDLDEKETEAIVGGTIFPLPENGNSEENWLPIQPMYGVIWPPEDEIIPICDCTQIQPMYGIVRMDDIG